MLKAFLVFLLTLSASVSCFGQVAAGIRVGMPVSLPAVTGKPYSAEQTAELVQTLADGTHIKQTILNQKIYRDSQGRTRTERRMQIQQTGSASPPELPIMIDITDPVAHLHYSFNTQSKTVIRLEMNPPTPHGGGMVFNQNGPSIQSTAGTMQGRVGAPIIKSGAQSDVARPQMTTEKLDPQTIDGIAVEGRRITTTYPAGSVGNDREIVATNEAWTSPELGIVIISKNKDPRNGEHIQKLSNISRDDPDPSLFQPPAGYEVIDQKNQPGGWTFAAPPVPPPPPPPGK